MVFNHQTGKLKGKVSHMIERSKNLLNNLGGNYKICITSADNEMFEKNKKLKMALIIDTDQDETEGKYLIF